MKSTNTRNDKPVLSVRAYLRVFAFIAAIGIGLTMGYVYVIPRLIAFGVEDKAFYILLLPWALFCAVCLFGLLRSYARITHKRFGTFVEFGGPAALFVTVVFGGFLLASNKQAFDLTVRAHGKGQPKIQNGQVTVECENFRRAEKFGSDNGEANFKGLPQRCWGNDKTRFLPEVNGFCQEWQAVSITSSAVDLELTPCLPHLSGVIAQLPRKTSDIIIVIDGKEQGGVDATGKFDIPISTTTGKVHLQVFIASTKKYDGYQTVPGNVRINMSNSNHRPSSTSVTSGPINNVEVRVRVLDKDGNLAIGAVYSCDADQPDTKKTLTGQFTCLVPAADGYVKVWAEKDGYDYLNPPLEVTAGPHTIRLEHKKDAAPTPP